MLKLTCSVLVYDLFRLKYSENKHLKDASIIMTKEDQLRRFILGTEFFKNRESILFSYLKFKKVVYQIYQI